jgi:protein-arginine kinase activator protein McsA
MICEKCHQREATCHGTVVADGVAVDRALCDECFALLAEPEVSSLFFATKSARCKFCGEPAVSGGMDAAESPGAARAMNSLCGRCGAEFWRYWQEQVATVSQDLPREEQMAAMRAMLEGAEQHMREWVKRRDGGG